MSLSSRVLEYLQAELLVLKMVTPMDVALAGLGVWRRQMQSAAIMGMRMSGLGAAWSMPPSEALDLVTKSQAEFAEASRRMSLALLEQTIPHRPDRGQGGGDARV
ncbi:MAG: hypothetical protein HLUCCA09_02475 [Rhodobacteraceae bacterium HLUCCA09]|nr:MAG: hypothetical protein HLUCCA09_02475 [Rhodobacteraceae bacterium HLUCCA09]